MKVDLKTSSTESVVFVFMLLIGYCLIFWFCLFSKLEKPSEPKTRPASHAAKPRVTPAPPKEIFKEKSIEIEELSIHKRHDI